MASGLVPLSASASAISFEVILQQHKCLNSEGYSHFTCASAQAQAYINDLCAFRADNINGLRGAVTAAKAPIIARIKWLEPSVE